MSKYAAVLLIGDELLSGRTQDVNLRQIAAFLGERGVQIAEARIVADKEDEIVKAARALCQLYDYVFTTGGIGPTHDDITAAAIAKAFDRPLERNPEAVRAIERRYAQQRPGQPLGEARLRMADMPQNVRLIDNPISGAPGFEIGNLFVLAGVPVICAAMLEQLAERITGGERWVSRTVRGLLGEGDIAEPLQDIQNQAPEVKIGSYPSFADGRPTLRIVLRAPETAHNAHKAATQAVMRLMRDLGGQPEEEHQDE